jgi:hypothetical protein
MRHVLTLTLLLAGACAGAVEAPPLQCWWRTDRVAVQVGEPLQLTLTCAAAETREATVMPDWDQLQPDVVDLAPFEVVAGTRSEAVVAPPWRYTQFEYTLRLTGEEFFGLDVPLPPLEIKYSIAVGPPGGSVQMGRERTYVLPPLPLKILALVPARADDIEDVTAHSFASIERRRSRAAMAFMVGCGLLAAGALCLLLFVGSAVRSLRNKRVRAPFRVAEWRVVAGCRAALRRLATSAGAEGWTDARVGEALPMLRVLGAVAIGMELRQQVVPRARPAGGGEWLLRRFSWQRPAVAVTATVTAARLRAEPARPFVAPQAVEDLAVALAACSDARYGRDVEDGARGAELSRAIGDAIESSGSLLRAAWLPVRWQVFARRHAASGAVHT